MLRHLPVTSLKVVPHRTQRYDTAGDYLESQYGTWRMTISEMSNWKYEAAVALHEFVEMVLTQANGITWEDIDEFDMNSDSDDPGTSPKAPYHNEHMLATQLEKKFIKMLGLDWHEYQKAFDELEYE